MSAANNASEIAPALHHATRFSTFMILSSSLPLLAAAPGQGLRGCATAWSNPRRSAQGRYQRILLRAGTEVISAVDLAGTGADNALATPRKQASCPPGLDSPATVTPEATGAVPSSIRAHDGRCGAGRGVQLLGDLLQALAGPADAQETDC